MNFFQLNDSENVHRNSSDSWFWDSGKQNDNIFPSLTWTQRAYGFFSCLAVSFLLSLLSWIAVFRRHWGTYGLLFTLSHLTSIASSCFLSGPTRQMKSMFHEKRLLATLVYFIAMVMTLVSALILHSGFLTILCCIVQYIAMLWYGLSYIPYGRSAVKSCVRGLV
ncbi:Got1 super family protein [Perkinsela sp. CCAP 1560/4]|nr:Got1 super family protein [Perkinsela sp. CCAP 1560/4]|eukprot:KNH07000.1 Got1 super family protein [Perkinsela sp. CCAP 1560/4]